MVIGEITPILVRTPRDTWAWVRVSTDSGLRGWGEYSGSPYSDAAVSAVLRVLGEGMAGKDPLDPEACLAPVRRWRYPSFLDSRFMMMAISALDMALWDIRAKSEGVPLCRLISSQMAGPIPLYANLNRLLRKDRSLDKLLSAALSASAAGLGMVKLAPFDEVTPLDPAPDLAPGLERFRRVAGAIGAERVSLDCHCRFTPGTFGGLLEALGPDLGRVPFLEDPVRIHHPQDIRPVHSRWPHLSYSSGEDCFSGEELARLADCGCLSILNPDLKYIGGVGQAAALIPRLLSSGVSVCLHNPSGPVATAHSAHLSTLCGGGTALEFAWGDSAPRDQAWGGREPVEGGAYHLPGGPGIGFEPSPAFLEQYGAPAGA